jgi:hypothetical protein
MEWEYSATYEVMTWSWAFVDGFVCIPRLRGDVGKKR